MAEEQAESRRQQEEIGNGDSGDGRGLKPISILNIAQEQEKLKPLLAAVQDAPSLEDIKEEKKQLRDKRSALKLKYDQHNQEQQKAIETFLRSLSEQHQKKLLLALSEKSFQDLGRLYEGKNKTADHLRAQLSLINDKFVGVLDPKKDQTRIFFDSKNKVQKDMVQAALIFYLQAIIAKMAEKTKQPQLLKFKFGRQISHLEKADLSKPKAQQEFSQLTDQLAQLTATYSHALLQDETRKNPEVHAATTRLEETHKALKKIQAELDNLQHNNPRLVHDYARALTIPAASYDFGTEQEYIDSLRARYRQHGYDFSDVERMLIIIQETRPSAIRRFYALNKSKNTDPDVEEELHTATQLITRYVNDIRRDVFGKDVEPLNPEKDTPKTNPNKPEPSSDQDSSEKTNHKGSNKYAHAAALGYLGAGAFGFIMNDFNLHAAAGYGLMGGGLTAALALTIDDFMKDETRREALARVVTSIALSFVVKTFLLGSLTFLPAIAAFAIAGFATGLVSALIFSPEKNRKNLLAGALKGALISAVFGGFFIIPEELFPTGENLPDMASDPQPQLNPEQVSNAAAQPAAGVASETMQPGSIAENPEARELPNSNPAPSAQKAVISTGFNIQSGDSLSKIVMQMDPSLSFEEMQQRVEVIALDNGLENINDIKAGDRLVIRDFSTDVSSQDIAQANAAYDHQWSRAYWPSQLRAA